jgi:excisionase family DNA binding protein
MKPKIDQSALSQLLTLQDAAGILNTSMKTLRRRIDDGQLPVIRDGRIVRVHPADLERYISARRSL